MIKDAKNIFMQGNVCIYSKSAKHILVIRGVSVFECHGDSLDLKPIQEDKDIIKMSCESLTNNKSSSVKVQVPFGILCRENNP